MTALNKRPTDDESPPQNGAVMPVTATGLVAIMLPSLPQGIAQMAPDSLASTTNDTCMDPYLNKLQKSKGLCGISGKC